MTKASVHPQSCDKSKMLRVLLLVASLLLANASPVEITYNLPGVPPITEYFDFLVVACDPRTIPFTERTPLEEQVVSSLSSFSFRTSLFLAKRPDEPQLQPDNMTRMSKPNYAVRYNPVTLTAMEGEIYGFRDEIMARDPEGKPSPNGDTWVTVYQINRKPLIGRNVTEAEMDFNMKRDATIADPSVKWVDFEPKGGANESVLVDYFPHFSKEALKDELPWKVRDSQGENSTMYVAAFTSFESVLHIFLYEDYIMKPDGMLMKKYFPKDKNARIAVIGAGPSGLMFASNHLIKKGYSNIKLFEKDSKFGGKTNTFERPKPANPEETVPCELGTCYLSLAYEPMYPMFEEHNSGSLQKLEKNDRFRGMVDKTFARNKEECENGVEYHSWTRRKDNTEGGDFTPEEYLIANLKYSFVHYAVMGMDLLDPMPDRPPEESTLRQKITSLVEKALKSAGVEDVKGKTTMTVKELYAFLKDESEDDGMIVSVRSTFIDALKELEPFVEVIDEIVDLKTLEDACDDIYDKTFREFVEKNEMKALINAVVYGYQVQGYGSIDEIPAYYGLVWITPPTITKALALELNPQPGNMGEVNLMAKGWGTLWNNMVERDLKGKIALNAEITSVVRH